MSFRQDKEISFHKKSQFPKEFRLDQVVYMLQIQRQAPIVMAFNSLVFSQTKSRIENQMRLLQSLQGGKRGISNFIIGIYQTEIERVEWLLKQYLRTRLRKIEKYFMQIQNQKHLFKDKLTDSELKYHQKYTSLRLNSYEKAVTNFMIKNLRFVGIQKGHQNLQTIIKNIEKMDVVSENKNSFVIAKFVGKKALRKNADVKVDSLRNTSPLIQGTVLLVPLSNIYNYLLTGQFLLL